ncbi:MAG: hypothetical protein ACE5E0_02910 [Terriglobia bacterium]
MGRWGWQVFFGISLLVLSITFYALHFFIFRDARHIFIYGLGDIAFVFVEVLMVSLIIHQLLGVRERRNRLQKMNMVIGTFFSEVGTKLLAYISDQDSELPSIKADLVVSEEWSDQNFRTVTRKLGRHNYSVDAAQINLELLRDMLAEKADFLLRLLENPTLIEHEAFTDLLQSVFHLNDELLARKNLKKPSSSDLAHLGVDVERVYSLLVREWLAYMKHLKANYPYLFAFAMRINPFDEKADPVVGS